MHAQTVETRGLPLAERVERAWSRERPVTEGIPSWAHPREFDDHGFPIQQRPPSWGTRAV